MQWGSAARGMQAAPATRTAQVCGDPGAPAALPTAAAPAAAAASAAASAASAAASPAPSAAPSAAPYPQTQAEPPQPPEHIQPPKPPAEQPAPPIERPCEPSSVKPLEHFRHVGAVEPAPHYFSYCASMNGPVTT